MSADYNLVPHLAHRQLIYTFPNPWTSSNYGVDGTEHPDPGAVQWLAVNTFLLDLPSRTLLDSLVSSGQFVVDSYDQGVVVAHRVKPPN